MSTNAIGPAPGDGGQLVAEVGLLFVHGIGQQGKGATLEEAGNALLAAAQSETAFQPALPDLEQSEDPPPTPRDQDNSMPADLTDVRIKGEGPATARLSIHPNGTDASHTWVLAESHWAKAFRPPSLAATLGWTLKVAPVVLLWRAVESGVSAYRAWGHPTLWMSWWRIGLAWVWALLVVPFSVLFMAGITGLVLLRALIPIQAVRDFLGRVEVVITGYLGDSYLFTANEIGRSAMVSQVASDIEWLAQRARRVIVVAHSQGAAVTAAALPRTRPVDTVITFGSGIGQLDWLRLSEKHSDVRSLRWRLYRRWLGGVGMALLAVWSVWVQIESGVADRWLFWFVLIGNAIFVTYLFASVSRMVSRHGRGGEADLSWVTTTDARLLTLRWWDIWASADPVPGGPSTGYSYSHIESFRVFNRGNLFTDHTAYYRNAEEFVGRVLLAALRPPGAGHHDRSAPPGNATHESPTRQDAAVALPRDDAGSLAEAILLRSSLRQRRGRWLEAWRASLVVFAAAVIGRWWHQSAAGAEGLIGWLASLFPAIAESMPALQHSTTHIFGGLLIVASGVLIVYWASLLIWWGWGNVERKLIERNLRLEDPQHLATRARISRAQLPFLIVCGSAPIVALVSSVAILVVGPDPIIRLVDRLSSWIVDVPPQSLFLWIFVPAALTWILFPYMRNLASKRSALDSGPGPIQRALDKRVRDPREYRPFRYEGWTPKNVSLQQGSLAGPALFLTDQLTQQSRSAES